MKKYQKWTLGILGILLVVIIVFAAMFWSSITILMGTEELRGTTDTIPEVTSAEEEPLVIGDADWISWQGVNGDNRAEVTGIKKDWSGGLKKLWEVNYLCQENSSATWSAPVIRGNRLIVCGRDSENDLVFCLNTKDGSLLWLGSYAAEANASHGSGPRATPYIDNDRVYTYGRSGDLVCWSLLDGEEPWTTNVSFEGGEAPQWGFASSPLVQGDIVIVQGGGSARTVAYDKITGKVLWKSGNGIAGYAAITNIDIDGNPVILSFHGKGLAAIDPKNGNELWNVPWETSFDVNATTPITNGERVFITSGYKTGGVMLKTSLTGAEPLWQNKTIASQHSDSFFIGGFLYGYSGDSSQNKGSFKCVDPESGAEIWTSNDIGWGTCVFADEHLLCMDIKGNLFLVKPDPENFIKKSEFRSALGDVKGPVWTKPVLANERLYLRFKQRLICYNIVQ
ncbi:MAG: PQQ-like beta-propeller repeat protein [Candidatus Latescibacteria bacterium]|jgi:outer membrane protein assembly factor BamB|nr:PQQ-like beta-propeller repeat protein [Candidatus Latescibacterota bacterium]